MAQQTIRMQIVQLTGVADSSITPFYNPLPMGANYCTVMNIDENITIMISTDDTGTPCIPIAAGDSFKFQMSGDQPWKKGDLMFYVSGAVVAQPLAIVSS